MMSHKKGLGTPIVLLSYYIENDGASFFDIIDGPYDFFSILSEHFQANQTFQFFSVSQQGNIKVTNKKSYE